MKSVEILKPSEPNDFDISNSTYRFNYDTQNQYFKSNNTGKSPSTAKTVLTLKESYEKIQIDYSVSSEVNYDKFTLKINNTVIANAISGVKTDTYLWENPHKGDTITLQYKKDDSSDGNDDCAIVKIVLISLKIQSAAKADKIYRRSTKQGIRRTNRQGRKTKL